MSSSVVREPNKTEKKVYDSINSRRKKYGIYHKTCFHLHTPESHDYKLLDEWDPNQYKASTDNDIFNLCIQRNVLLKGISIDDITLDNELSIFSSRKELLSFLLLADKLISEKIEIVLVADHNTIAGVCKLRAAIEHLYPIKNKDVYPTVLLGVEVSCADKNHVVGIFDTNDDSDNELNKWLSDNIIDVENGSFRISADVLDFIHSHKGIGYIAHINSSDILKENLFSGAFKKHLFADNSLNYVGLSELEQRTRIAEKIKNYRNTDIKFVLDNDSHTIDSVSKNLFWLKGEKCTFSMVKEALNDYHISVEFSLPAHPNQYIKGIYIEASDSGFLTGKNGEDYCLRFSNALNCLIGGRGTGKSTVLEILEYALSQRVSDERKLNYICSHGTIWVIYEVDGIEYLIQMTKPRKKYEDESILSCFGQNRDGIYRYKYYFDKDSVRQFAARYYLKVYKVLHTSANHWKLETVDNPRKLMDSFFDSRYSVNELVNTAQGNDINEFIFNTMFKNRTISDPSTTIKTIRSSACLKKILSESETAFRQRETDINDVIEPYNEQRKKELRIKYTQQINAYDPDFDWLLYGKKRTGQWYEKYNIEKTAVLDYLSNLYRKMGAFAFFRAVMDRSTEALNTHERLKTYATPMKPKMIEQGLTSITSENESLIIENILAKLTVKENLKYFQVYFKGLIRHSEKFSLEFNINNKEGGGEKPVFKPIQDLSLGQKVVAMLTFVLGYSDYSRDYRPLIIDQPEDNLDNSYIYRNLVKQLREIKEKRQVIIATHNATIVTNAKSDMVCVMQSDNEHGWVDATGYPSESGIKKKIIDHLEGGKESFIHKVAVYGDVLS